MGIINNVLISFDVQARANPASMANQLTLIELFSELRRSSFLVFTKWNTSSVAVAWNTPMRDYMRKWKRAKTLEEITEDPPSYEVMYTAFCKYVGFATSRPTSHDHLASEERKKERKECSLSEKLCS